MQQEFKNLKESLDAATEKANAFRDKTAADYERSKLNAEDVQDNPELADDWEDHQCKATRIMDDAYKVADTLADLRTAIIDLTEQINALNRQSLNLAKMFRPEAPSEATHYAEFYTIEDDTERTHTVYAVAVNVTAQCEVHGFRTTTHEHFFTVLEEWVDGVQVEAKEDADDYDLEWVEMDDR